MNSILFALAFAASASAATTTPPAPSSPSFSILVGLTESNGKDGQLMTDQTCGAQKTPLYATFDPARSITLFGTSNTSSSLSSFCVPAGASAGSANAKQCKSTLVWNKELRVLKHDGPYYALNFTCNYAASTWSSCVCLDRVSVRTAPSSVILPQGVAVVKV